MSITFENTPAVDEERVQVVADASNHGGTVDPTYQRIKMVYAAYHPGDVVRTCLKYLSSELDFGSTTLTREEHDLLSAYYQRFPRRGEMNFYDWVRYVLASEFAARAFHVEEL